MSLNATSVLVDSILDSQYNYIPTRWITILVLTLFSISTFLHIGQAVCYRLWWLFPTIITAGFTEIAGWAARVYGSSKPSNYDAYIMQMITTSLAPTFMVAANFIILGRIINRAGTCYSRIPPRLYSIIFLSADVATLIIQGIGGAIAGSADHNLTKANHGARIMLAGIGVQLGIMGIYALFALEFFLRYANDRPISLQVQSSETLGKPRPRMTLRLKMMTSALILNTIILLIRNAYRVVELTDGWNGRIISTEVYFNVLDGGMVVLAVYTMNLIHPGYFLREPHHIADEPLAVKQAVAKEVWSSA